MVHGFPFAAKMFVTVLFYQSQLVGAFGKAHICIVLSEQDAVFGTGGEHTIRFVHTFCNQIVNQDTDVGLVPSQCERFATVAIDVCVDAGNDSLSACFFVTGSSVYLSGKEQVLDYFDSNVCFSWVGSK